MTHDIGTIWEFVTKYYPDYDHCSQIAYSDDLHQLVTGEHDGISDNSTPYEELDSKQMVFRNFNGNMNAIKDEYNSVMLEIYKKAIQAFMEQQKPVTVGVVFGEEKVTRYDQYGVIGEREVTNTTFNSQAEADAYLRGVDDMDGYLKYLHVEYSNDVLSILTFDNKLPPMHLNTFTGETYRNVLIDGENCPLLDDDDNTPVHLDDIVVRDWWDALSDKDWQTICLYHTPLAQYTAEDISKLFEHSTRPRIKQILDKSQPVPDNARVFCINTGQDQSYQDNEDFIHNVLEEPTNILYNASDLA